MSSESWVLLGCAVVPGLIACGMLQAQVWGLKERVDHLSAAVDSMSDTYVNYRHFNEIMTTIKEAQKELRDDLKKVLELLSSR